MNVATHYLNSSICIFIFIWICSCAPFTEDKSDPVKQKEVIAYIAEAVKYRDLFPDSALFFAEKAFSLSRQINDDKGFARSSLIIADIALQKGEYRKANAYLVESIEVHSLYNKAADLGQAYNLKGLIYQKNEQMDAAKTNYFKALHQFRTFNDSGGVATVFWHLGHLFEKSANYDSAMYFNLQAQALYEMLDDSTGLAMIYDNIGSVYEDNAEHVKARDNFEKGYQININTRNYSEAIINLNNVADTYRKTGNYEKALDLYSEVLKESKRLGQRYQKKSAYRDLARTYSLMGDYRRAFTYLDSCYATMDKIAASELARGIEESRSVYELDRKQAQIEILKKDKQLQTMTTNALIAFTFLIGGIAFLLYSRMKSKLRIDKKLYEAERKLEAAKKDKLESELRLKKLYETKIKEEYESMSKELATNALNIMRKNKLLGNVKNELTEIASSNGNGGKRDLKKTISTIDTNFAGDEKWREFESMFQQIHISFFDNLNSTYPNLTSSETRLCAMIKLNLSSREMANILGISQSSLRVARYRLRKKLGIPKGANLYNYILSIH